MTKRITQACALGVLLLGVTLGANAQQSTEQYIPIGESPGVSDEQMVKGTISAVDYDARTVQVRMTTGTQTVKMVGSTRYYLDRTKHKRTNLSAKIEDCRVGRKVEVKVDADSTVDWIKIEAD